VERRTTEGSASEGAGGGGRRGVTAEVRAATGKSTPSREPRVPSATLARGLQRSRRQVRALHLPASWPRARSRIESNADSALGLARPSAPDSHLLRFAGGGGGGGSGTRRDFALCIQGPRSSIAPLRPTSPNSPGPAGFGGGRRRRDVFLNFALSDSRHYVCAP
jgi:hypothetical protein